MVATFLARISLVPVVWTLLGIFAAIGLLAVVSPGRFSTLTQHSSTWIDTNKLLSKLDTRVDIDKYVLPFSRALGVGVLLAVAIIAYLYWTYAQR